MNTTELEKWIAIVSEKTEKDSDRSCRPGNIYLQAQQVSEQHPSLAHSGKTTLRSMLSRRRQSNGARERSCTAT